MTDNVGDSASVELKPGRVKFGTWINDLVIHNRPRLDIAQSRFVAAALSDSTRAWSITASTLTIDLGGGGSLVFTRHTFDARQAFGSASGQFTAAGGPASLASTRPIHGIGTVEFTNTDSGQTQTIDTTTGGNYATWLVPGTYTVAGKISTYNEGQGVCTALQPVEVRAGRDTNVDVYCQEK